MGFPFTVINTYSYSRNNIVQPTSGPALSFSGENVRQQILTVDTGHWGLDTRSTDCAVKWFAEKYNGDVQP